MSSSVLLIDRTGGGWPSARSSSIIAEFEGERTRGSADSRCQQSVKRSEKCLRPHAIALGFQRHPAFLFIAAHICGLTLLLSVFAFSMHLSAKRGKQVVSSWGDSVLAQDLHQLSGLRHLLSVNVRVFRTIFATSIISSSSSERDISTLLRSTAACSKPPPS